MMKRVGPTRWQAHPWLQFTQVCSAGGNQNGNGKATYCDDVCLYSVSMYVYVICMYACLHVCMCMSVCMDVCMYVCMMYVLMRVCVFV